MSNTNPLISIVVTTYNQQNYVIETLESAKAQTYQNIELIITDDCSQDNTVEVCRKWIKENNDRFVRTEIVTTDKNTATAGNSNRGCKAAKGDWIKVIAADDALESFYCEKIVKFINNNPDALCIVTDVTKYKDTFTDENIIEKTRSKKYKFFKDDVTAEEQFQILLRKGGIIYVPGAIVNKKVYENVNYYDEKYKYYEDRPLWVNITKAGYKIHLYEIYGAKYRVHSASMQSRKNKLWSNIDTFFYFACIDWMPFYPFIERITRKYVLNIEYRYYNLFNNKKNIFASGIVFLLTYIPNLYLRLVKRRYV